MQKPTQNFQMQTENRKIENSIVIENPKNGKELNSVEINEGNSKNEKILEYYLKSAQENQLESMDKDLTIQKQSDEIKKLKLTNELNLKEIELLQ